jgi:hypothetical protein
MTTAERKKNVDDIRTWVKGYTHNHDIEKDVKFLLSEIDLRDTALRLAREKLHLAFEAFEKNWAIDWNEIKTAELLTTEALGLE